MVRPSIFTFISIKVLKKVKHAKNVLVVRVLQIYAGKSQKKKDVGTWGHKFVKREKLAQFWYG